MDETHQLVDALKRCVKVRGLTYRTLASRIGLSEASVKRIFAERSFTVRRLEQVCKAMDMSVTELIRMIDRSASAVTMLSVEQETALARDPALLSYFYLLLNGWLDTQILREYEFDQAQLERLRDTLIELRVDRIAAAAANPIARRPQACMAAGWTRASDPRAPSTDGVFARRIFGPWRVCRLATRRAHRKFHRRPEAQARAPVRRIPADGRTRHAFHSAPAQHRPADRIPPLGLLSRCRSPTPSPRWCLKPRSHFTGLSVVFAPPRFQLARKITCPTMRANPG